MKKALSKKIRIVISVAIFLIAIFFALATANAESKVALMVKLDGEVKKTFTIEELQSIAQSEGNKTYTYSLWNTYPTWSSTEVVGPTVEAVLKQAGVLSSVQSDCLVYFSDGAYKVKLTGFQLMNEERYYYPNGKLARPGHEAVTTKARSDKVKVPATISLDGEDTKFCIGQVDANEENNPVWVQGVAKGGYINVTSEKAQKCESIKAVSTIVKPGEAISFLDFPDNYSRTSPYKNDSYYDKVYYSIGGTSAGYGCAVYNNGPQNDEIDKPVIDTEGKYTINILVKGYGKLDSDITSFDVSVSSGAFSIKSLKSFKLAAAKKSFTAKWAKPSAKNLSKFSGYQIRYCKDGGKWSSWKNVKKSASSVTIKKLTSKAKYNVQFRSYVKEGEEVYYSNSLNKTVKIK